MAGVTKNGTISEVCVKGSDGVEKEFLAQFRGKKINSNFEIAKTPEDLMSIPSPLKAMGANAALSAVIAQGVREIALAAGDVLQ